MSTSPESNNMFRHTLENLMDAIKADPTILHKPEYAHIRFLIQMFGGKIPPPVSEEKSKSNVTESEPTQIPKEKPAAGSEESDLELDKTGVIEPDTDAPQKMGDPTVQPTEDDIAKSQEKRSEAVSAFAEKDYDKAIELYTEAILLNPQASLLYAKRSQVYLMQQKPNACIRDCNQALKINPDSAVAHKCRGRANQLIGNWEEAASDLRLACKFDFDEEANQWLREVTPNARKIEDHKRKMERQAQEKLEREKQEKIKNAKDGAQAREEKPRPSQPNASKTQTPMMEQFYKFVTDSEVLEAFKDPEIVAAFTDLSTNPVNILKYQNNPKVMDFVSRIASKLSGSGAWPGNIPGMAGFPGSGAGARATPNTDTRQSAPQPDDDVGLD